MELPEKDVKSQVSAKDFKQAARVPSPGKEETDSFSSVSLTPPESPPHLPYGLTPDEYQKILNDQYPGQNIVYPFVRPEPKIYDPVTFYYHLTPKQQKYVQLATFGIVQGIVIGIGAYYGRQAIGAVATTAFGLISKMRGSGSSVSKPDELARKYGAVSRKQESDEEEDEDEEVESKN